MTKPELSRGDAVIVREPGRKEWHGEVVSIKPTKKAWWVEVRENGERVVWIVPPKYVERVSN